MGGFLCNTVTGFAGLFIILAFAVATIEAAIAIIANWEARKTQSKLQDTSPLAMEALGPGLDALAKVLAALKDLPPWIAMFLAGLALSWTAGTAPGLCP